MPPAAPPRTHSESLHGASCALPLRPSAIVCRARCAWLSFAIVLVGCALPAARIERPERFVRSYDQLIVHSNFELPAEHRLLAELMALRGRLATDLALPVSAEPIHIYLFDNADRFADFLALRYPEFPQRRAFFVESDTQLSVYAYWGDRVAEDLRHEVVHGYLHAVVSGLPLWLDEGLAESYETPRGHWGLNPAHLRRLISERQSGAWQPNLRRLESFTSIDQMRQTDYAEAWAWVHWLQHGDAARTAALRDYLAQLRAAGAAPPISARLGGVTPGPEAQLVEHLKRLASQPPPLAVD